MRYSPVFIISLLILSSCSHKNEAIELSRDFFTSLSDTTYGKPSDFYPQYDSLGIEAKSDIVDIEHPISNNEQDTGTWYTLDGVKHDKRPIKKGLYIKNGKKIVIK